MKEQIQQQAPVAITSCVVTANGGGRQSPRRGHHAGAVPHIHTHAKEKKKQSPTACSGRRGGACFNMCMLLFSGVQHSPRRQPSHGTQVAIGSDAHSRSCHRRAAQDQRPVTNLAETRALA